MNGLPRVSVTAAAALALIAATIAVVDGSVLAALPALLAAMLAVVPVAARARPQTPENIELVEKMSHQIETGRKLVIYERETGLFAHWYVTLRGEEECDRAARYERTLGLLLVEPAPGANTWGVQDHLADWIRRTTRTTDVAGYLGNARYIVLMPETDRAGADNLLRRLQEQVDQVESSLTMFPGDGVTFDTLYAAAAARLAGHAEAVA